MPQKSLLDAEDGRHESEALSAEVALNANNVLATGLTSISLKTDPASETREARRRGGRLLSSHAPAFQGSASALPTEGVPQSALLAISTTTPSPVSSELVPTNLAGADHLARRQEQLEAIYGALEKANIRFKSNLPKEHLIEIARAREDICTQKRPFHAQPTAYSEEKYLDLTEYEITKKIDGADGKSWSELIAKHPQATVLPPSEQPSVAQISLHAQLIPSVVESKLPGPVRQKQLITLFEAYREVNSKHLRAGHAILQNEEDLVNLSRQAEEAHASAPTKIQYEFRIARDIEKISVFKTRDWWRAVAKFLRPFQVAPQDPAHPDLLPWVIEGVDMNTTRQNRLNTLYNTLGLADERHIRGGISVFVDAEIVQLALILEARSVRTFSRIRTEDEYLEEIQESIETYWHSTQATWLSLVQPFDANREQLRKQQQKAVAKEPVEISLDLRQLFGEKSNGEDENLEEKRNDTTNIASGTWEVAASDVKKTIHKPTRKILRPVSRRTLQPLSDSLQVSELVHDTPDSAAATTLGGSPETTSDVGRDD
ncbi:uncharacterized protein BDZ99DRAFT_527300 [Mytilinidion resinicola]|uniref:Uncharacterized protein n=1 Tax=Mytilinidion resinicola TaxID=574789 RepID=A0A6A6Y231_9PEZI|nr:uncharacterized protein BDZ99DRAFT_527300 [Mytilinidion resinicola]KAF2802573.1 hypothetical protein BDZ99DRAFT_527300 [Mytilinidion resinicola]